MTTVARVRGAGLALAMLLLLPQAAAAQANPPAQAQPPTLVPGQPPGAPAVPVQAQRPVEPQAVQAPPRAPSAAAQPAPANPSAPSDALVALVRGTLLAFNQANLTGNYGVLFAMAAPAFQRESSPEKLSASFASFRERKIDASSIAVLTPQLTAPAQIDSNGLLRVVGAFPSPALQLRFNIAYQQIEGSWRFVGLAVDVQAGDAQSAPTASVGPAAAPPPPAPAKRASPAAPAAASRPVAKRASPKPKPRVILRLDEDAPQTTTRW